MKILILASNPRKDLNLDREIRDLKRAIENSRHREEFEVVDELAVRVEDLQELLHKHRPQIVHFCGHGGGEQGLVFESDMGREQLVETDALSGLFRLFSSSVECVLLNACYSEEQAGAIVDHINYVIGMNQEIRDDAAIAFSKGFYRALGYACSIEQSYEFGCNAIQLEISGSSLVRSAVSEAERKLGVANTVTKTLIPEHLKPILKTKPSIINNNQTLSQEKRAEIQLDIDKSLAAGSKVELYRDRNINFVLTQTLSDAKGTIWCCAISPNGQLVAASSGPISGGLQIGWMTVPTVSDNTIRIWNIESGKLIHSISGYGKDFPSLAFGSSADNLILAGGSGDNTIKLWDVNTRRELRTLAGHSQWVDVVAFAPNGTILASGSNDGTIKIWDVQTGYELVTLPEHQGLVDSIAFSPDGAILASCSGDKITLWDAQKSRLLHTFSGHTGSVRSVAFSPSSQILASGSNDKTIKLWHLETKQELHTLYGHSKEVQSVAFMPNSNILASGSWDSTIRIWDVDTGKCLNTLFGHNNVIYSVAFSSDGQILVSGSADTTVKIWKHQ
ncbi:CHAT domain-containing protein [Floridanema evergladense]|uniref:CHAT domain-containing protein n=1 Tax=Floridaenema evergladense BLCC-F167 TaxID=3153639 RepID=A0ABV4WNF6_9CYAN